MRKQSTNKKVRRQDMKVHAKATRTLRALGNEEAFRFYEDVDRPTGESARSLRGFLERIESVKLESLIFHLTRNDFKNWIANTLEDTELARRLGKIPVTHNDRLRTKICSTVRNRLKELDKATDSVTICVDEPAIVAI